MSENENASKDEPNQNECWDLARVDESLIRRHTALAAAAGLMPIPGFDFASVVGVSLNLTKRLSEAHGIGFSREAGMNVVLSLLSGSIPVVARASAASLLKSIPVIGSVAGAATAPLLNGALVYATGKVLVRHYSNGGTLMHFDAPGVREYFQQQVECGKQVAQEVS